MGVLIVDLLESNVNALTADLRGRIVRLSDVYSSAEVGGDFAVTVRAQIDVTKAALKAAERVFTDFTKPSATLNPTHGTGVVTWGEKLSDERDRLGRDLTHGEVLSLAGNHIMTEGELEEQRGAQLLCPVDCQPVDYNEEAEK